MIKKEVDKALADLEAQACSVEVVHQDIITSVNTSILSMREFKTKVQCVNCKNNIELEVSDEPIVGEEELVICKTCGSRFLIGDGKVINECAFLLKANKEWYLAKTAVSVDKFNTNECF